MLIDDEAYSNQKEYIMNTKKPPNLPMKRWFLKLKAINTFLLYLDITNGGAVLNESDLAKIITNTISDNWKARFKLANEDISATTTETLKV